MGRIIYKGNKNRVTLEGVNLIEQHANILCNLYSNIHLMNIYDLFTGSISLAGALLEKDSFPLRYIANDINKNLMDYYAYILEHSLDDIMEEGSKYILEANSPLFKIKHGVLGFIRRKNLDVTFNNRLKELIYAFEMSHPTNESYLGGYTNLSASAIQNNFFSRCKYIQEIGPKVQLSNYSFDDMVLHTKGALLCKLVKSNNDNIICISTDNSINNNLNAFYSNLYTEDILLKYIDENSIYYLDPPYYGTTGYNVDFDTARLIRWLRGEYWSTNNDLNTLTYNFLHQNKGVFLCEYEHNLDMYLKNGINLEVLSRNEVKHTEISDKKFVEVFCRVIPHTTDYLTKYSKYWNSYVDYFECK